MAPSLGVSVAQSSISRSPEHCQDAGSGLQACTDSTRKREREKERKREREKERKREREKERKREREKEREGESLYETEVGEGAVANYTDRVEDSSPATVQKSRGLNGPADYNNSGGSQRP